MSRTKSFPITKIQVWEAWKSVKANKGGGGVDGQTLEEFEQDLSNNLYKLWNRMASGSYMPQPVRRVEIPKAGGGIRPLGVPTVTDRVAQMVVKQEMEGELENVFHPDSYGYRSGKSAHQALGQARKRCWRSDWVVDLDIKSFFDSIDHELLAYYDLFGHLFRLYSDGVPNELGQLNLFFLLPSKQTLTRLEFPCQTTSKKSVFFS